MIEVHPPHEKVHSWTQFFIHIAAITIGLLMAIGLEQTVVYFHHRHQLQEARRELADELESNRRVVGINLEATRKVMAELDADMALLRAVQASAASQSPAPIGSKLVYGLGNFYWPKDATWQAVKQNGSLGLMAHDELHYYVYIYEDIAIIMEQMSEMGARMEVARAIARRSPDGNLTPRDIEELITTTSEVQAKVAYGTLLLRLEENALQKKTEEIPKIEQKLNQH
ncbi:MAG TPA: hypothetical protein VNX27_10145 [Chthoniobacterales bacterium]|jgi:hypothetical protein|nr:hypothetical protein [Chthoniobacterales bacterium]